MDNERCPHCENVNCIRPVIFSHVENYGSQIFHLPCIQCGKMIKVSTSRCVVINSITKSSKPEDESDF